MQTRMSGRAFLALLALPAFALALASTMVTTYLPIFIERLSGPLVTGVLIGAEGLVAVAVPILIGSYSDRVQSKFGGRMPFLIGAAPVMALVLIAMPFAGSLVVLASLIFAFYLAYFVYYPPYRALYPDLVPADQRGRSQGAQKTLRELGLVVALVSGGVLLSLWDALPFLLAAAVVALTSAVFVYALRDDDRGRVDGGAEGSENSPLAEAGAQLSSLLDDRRIRWLAVANGLWEMALGTIKAFVVLFFTVGLGRSAGFGSLVLGIAAVAIIAAALTGGRLADRHGNERLMRLAVPAYGVGLIGPLVSQSPFVLAIVPPTAFAGGIVMTLAFSMMMELMPEEHHGSASGLFELSRGVGTLAGPLVAGAAIAASASVLDSTEGYAAMWAVASLAVLASIPALRRSAAPAGNE